VAFILSTRSDQANSNYSPHNLQSLSHTTNQGVRFEGCCKVVTENADSDFDFDFAEDEKEGMMSADSVPISLFFLCL